MHKMNLIKIKAFTFIVAYLILHTNITYASIFSEDQLALTTSPIELHSTALEIQDYMNKADVYTLLNRIDHSIIKRAIDTRFRLHQKTLETSTIFAQFEQSFQNNGHEMFSNIIRAALKNGYEWDYLHYRTYKKNHLLTFHIQMGDQEEYVTLKATKMDETWKIVDWYTHSNEFWLSEVLGLMIDIAAITSKDDDPATFLAAMKQFSGDDSQQAVNTAALSPDLSKLLLAARMQKADVSERANYISTVSELLQQAYSTDFILMRAGLAQLQEDYTSALIFISQLERTIGKNPYLKIARIENLFLQGQRNQAIEGIQEMVIDYGDKESTYYLLIIVLANNGMFDSVTQIFEILQGTFKLELNFEMMSEMEELKAFFQSPEFNAWHKNQQQTSTSMLKNQSGSLGSA